MHPGDPICLLSFGQNLDQVLVADGADGFPAGLVAQDCTPAITSKNQGGDGGGGKGWRVGGGE